MKRISLYWKFQLIGWAILTMLIYLFQYGQNKQNYYKNFDYYRFFIVDIIGLIVGLIITHLFRITIRYLRMFEKPFRSQMIYFAGLTLFFSMLATFVWLIILVKTGALKIRLQFTKEIDFMNEWIGYSFFVFVIFLGWLAIYFLFHYVKGEQEKLKMHLQMVELEAKALRAQMNPHFIFNCLNSIKYLLQERENEKGINYLTTFSKLIRTLFNNADKKEISLYDEIETCKYYLQLEAMRFDAKFSYSVNVDENIDLKSIQVPALIIQPFIENAIWHGIVPRGSGGNVSVNVVYKEGNIEISIDDDGIGREASAKSRSTCNLTHQSKGVNLTQSRLELNNLLQQRHAILETIDKKDEQGNSTGTTVIIKIKEELS